MEFFDLTFLSLNVELMSTLFAFCCLSVDESRDTVKNIFTSLTVIMWKRKIWDKLFKLYLKLKHFLHWFEKYLICDQQNLEPEVLIKFRKKWSNWGFSRPNSKNGHVTHHFAVFLLLITISTFLLRKKSLRNRKSRN